MDSKVDFSSLPQSILLQIFSNLDISDRFLASHVCKTWYKTATDAPFDDGLVLKFENLILAIDKSPVVQFLVTRRRFKEIILDNCSIGDGLEPLWVRIGPRVKTFSYKRCTPDGWLGILPHLPEMKTFTLQQTIWDQSMNRYLSCGQTFPSVQEICLIGTFRSHKTFEAFMSLFPAADILDFTSSDIQDPESSKGQPRFNLFGVEDPDLPPDTGFNYQNLIGYLKENAGRFKGVRLPKMDTLSMFDWNRTRSYDPYAKKLKQVAPALDLLDVHVGVNTSCVEEMFRALSRMPRVEQLHIECEFHPFEFGRGPDFWLFSDLRGLTRLRKLKTLYISPMPIFRDFSFLNSFKDLQTFETERMRLCSSKAIDHQLKRNLNMENLNLGTEKNCKDLVRQLVEAYPNLCYLQIGYINKEDLAHIFGGLKRLHTLDVYGAEFDEFALVGRKSSGAKQARISTINDLQQLTHLKVLELELTELSTAQFRLPKLKTLEVRRITAEGLELLAKNCATLENLSFTLDKELRDIKKVWKALKGLKLLRNLTIRRYSLKDNEKIATDEDLLDILASCKQLRALSWFEKIDNFFEIFEKSTLRNLYSSTLNGCRRSQYALEYDDYKFVEQHPDQSDGED